MRVCGLVLSAVLLCARPAWAVSLGEVQTVSHLGEVLQVRIPVTASADEGLNAECVRLEGPRAENSDDLPWLRAGRLRFSTGASGQQVLLVSSLQPIHSPAIMIAVRIDCNTALRREYTVLLDPPTAKDSDPAIQSAQLPIEPSSKASANLWRTTKGESLRSIARGLFPTDRLLQSRYISLLRQRNAAKLQGLADNSSLAIGTELSVPEPSELDSTPRPARSKSSEQLPATTAPEVRAAPPTRLASAPRQRLVVGGDERSGMQMETSLSGRRELSEKEREKLRAELQLIATLDDKIATQLELSEKLRQLEGLQAQLQSDVHGLEARIRTQQAALQSAPGASALPPPMARLPVTPVKAEATARLADLPWRDWLLPAAGGALAVLVLLAILRHRRARDIGSDEALTLADAHATNKDKAREEQPADDLFEPLQEDDIWPDAPVGKRPPNGHTQSLSDGISGLGAASVLNIVEDVEEHSSAVELAEIMMSFGRVQGAAQTLADFIRANPRQAVKPWVKLLEVYKTANMRVEFEALTSQLNKTFNVKPVTWDEFDVALRAPESLEHIPHIAQNICETWGKRECQAYLHMLLRDNRQGTRQGFPLAMIDEILLLLAVLESQLGPYKPDADVVDEPVPLASSPTMSAPAPTRPPAIEPEYVETMSAQPSAREPDRSALDFNVDTADFDLGMNTDDLTRTLHIDLDDLPVDQTAMPFELPKRDDV